MKDVLDYVNYRVGVNVNWRSVVCGQYLKEKVLSIR